MIKILQTTEKFLWTRHSIEKMKFYGLSENRIKRVLKNPKRTQEGIVFGTTAIMQSTGSKKHPTEIWAMYIMIGSKKKIISCWRYPCVSPAGKEIPIPEEYREEIEREISKFKVKR